MIRSPLPIPARRVNPTPQAGRLLARPPHVARPLAYAPPALRACGETPDNSKAQQSVQPEKSIHRAAISSTISGLALHRSCLAAGAWMVPLAGLSDECRLVPTPCASCPRAPCEPLGETRDEALPPVEHPQHQRHDHLTAFAFYCTADSLSHLLGLPGRDKTRDGRYLPFRPRVMQPVLTGDLARHQVRHADAALTQIGAERCIKSTHGPASAGVAHRTWLWDLRGGAVDVHHRARAAGQHPFDESAGDEERRKIGHRRHLEGSVVGPQFGALPVAARDRHDPAAAAMPRWT
jgi:hypothetical protein